MEKEGTVLDATQDVTSTLDEVWKAAARCQGMNIFFLFVIETCACAAEFWAPRVGRVG
jgi:hypothetical protein